MKVFHVYTSDGHMFVYAATQQSASHIVSRLFPYCKIIDVRESDLGLADISTTVYSTANL